MGITCAIWRKKMMRPIKDNSLSTSKTALLPIPSKACTQRLMLLFERTRKPWQKTDKGGQAQEVERQKDYLGRPKSQDQEYQGGIPCPNRGPKRIRFLFLLFWAL